MLRKFKAPAMERHAAALRLPGLPDGLIAARKARAAANDDFIEISDRRHALDRDLKLSADERARQRVALNRDVEQAQAALTVAGRAERSASAAFARAVEQELQPAVTAWTQDVKAAASHLDRLLQVGVCLKRDASEANIPIVLDSVNGAQAVLGLMRNPFKAIEHWQA